MIYLFKQILTWIFRRRLKPSLPHPEEKPDYSQTADNIDLDAVFAGWYQSYNVPAEYRDYWQHQIVIEIDDTLNYPACAWGLHDKRYLSVRPEWCNPGVIAHEQAHNSYDLLTDDQKDKFKDGYTSLIKSDLKLLFSTHPYGLTSTAEAHAEIYRYLGQSMPKVLKKYYPKLF